MKISGKSSGTFSPIRLAALLILASTATALHAQTVRIELRNGKTGRPLSSTWLSRDMLQLWFGPQSDLSLILTADNHGVTALRFTRNNTEINVPDCKGKRAAEDQLLKNNLAGHRDKNDEREFNEKYKNCMNLLAKNPIVGYADSISIGPIMSGTTSNTYIQCWAGVQLDFSTEEILEHGVVTPNSCGKATASPVPGSLILFVRMPTLKEQWEQAN